MRICSLEKLVAISDIAYTSVRRSVNKKLYLIDGHALAYRSYFAMLRTPLTNSKGQPTGAVYGTALSLLKLLQDFECPYIAAVFDSDKPTFRHELYPEYKANREAMPDDMISQMPLIEKLFSVLNIPTLSRDGLEADDIIAYMTRAAEKQGFEVYLLTKDKDLMQLVNENVTMLAPETGGKLNALHAAEVVAKMGVGPEKIRDFLALTGDASDNVPGVPGVGPKTAVRILEKAGTIDSLLENPSCLENKKLIEKIENNRDAIVLSKELVTLKDGLDIELQWDSFAARPVKKQECIEFFKELDFKSLLNYPLFENSESLSFSAVVPESVDEVESFCRKIDNAGFVSIDTETTSTEPRKAGLVGIAMAIDTSSALYIPVGHEHSDRNLPLQEVLGACREMIESSRIKKIGQNLKYDFQVFKNYGITMSGIEFDTMVAAYVIDPGTRRYGLDSMALDFLNCRTTSIETLIGKGTKQVSFSTVAVKDAASYSGEDVIVPLLLKEKFEKMLQEKKVSELFREIEMPLVPVLAEMEWNGILIDALLLKKMSEEYQKQLEEISQNIYDSAGEEFNLNSPKQISDVFFNKLGLPKSRKTKTGLSTNVDALEKLAPDYPVARLLLDYREVQKLLSTYIDALPQRVYAKTGRVHSSFNQTIAATGRLSSTNPNLQNIPVRTDDGRRIREAFVAPEKYVIVSADYSQIELRILAHVSRDPLLIQAFKEDRDIHAQTASVMYNTAIELVSPEMRRSAKTINFGLMYGMGPVNLARQLNISFKEARHFIETYFEQFPTIRSYMDMTIENARLYGYTETLLGRRRYLPEINAQSRQVREAAERTAINTPIQGTAADIIKIAMVRIHEEIEQKFPSDAMLLQVHDELVFEVKESHADTFVKWVVDTMSSAYELTVPLKVDAGTGVNWSVAH
ncbi:MAG: DNA polymerase I [Chitinivibrionales bacterium]|nr:DNA polymerase I [Chitinivibrionales bacterium]